MPKTSYTSPAYWPEVKTLSDLSLHIKKLYEKQGQLLLCVSNLVVAQNKLTTRLLTYQREQGAATRKRALKNKQLLSAVEASIIRLLRQQSAFISKLEGEESEAAKLEVRFNNVKKGRL